LVKKLEGRHINVELVDNDLLIDGKKFFGCMQQEIGKMHFIGGHISIDCDLDLIKQVCTKPMGKTPVGLSQYQITTKDVVD
jgi:lipoate-protein ligase A